MALIDPTKRTRLDIPHEPGEWVEVRPITVRITRQIFAHLNTPDFNFEFLKAVIGGWSYNVPVTPENIDAIDNRTQGWLLSAIDLSGERLDDEKKDSNAPSPPGLTPTTPTSKATSGLVSSAT